LRFLFQKIYKNSLPISQLSISIYLFNIDKISKKRINNFYICSDGLSQKSTTESAASSSPPQSQQPHQLDSTHSSTLLATSTGTKLLSARQNQEENIGEQNSRKFVLRRSFSK
jgi:hypothetical protein